MSVDRFTISNDFPAVPYAAWQKIAQSDLQSTLFHGQFSRETVEGLELQPLYTGQHPPVPLDASGTPGTPPFLRGNTPLGGTAGWDIRQVHNDPLLSAARQAIAEDIHGGVTSLILELDRAACSGRDPDDPLAEGMVGVDGLTVYHANDFERLLDGVNVSDVPIAIDAGATFFPAAAVLAALWTQRHVDSSTVRGAFNADPIGVLARDGALPFSLDNGWEQLGDLAKRTAEQFPHVTSVAVSTAPYYDAGATATQELAIAMATAVQYLRTMCERGIAIDTACRQILFRICVGTDHFLSIAKLRAARRLWWHVVDICGGTVESGSIHMEARIGNRNLTRREPSLNLIRNAIALFGAGLGGACTVISVPFDTLFGPASPLSRRLARNTALILQDEANLHRVIDPAGGCWYVEALTNQLAERAWHIVQRIEEQGGIVPALQSGWIGQQIQDASSLRQQSITNGDRGIIGVTEFPDHGAAPVQPVQRDGSVVRHEACQRLSNGRSRQPVSAQFPGSSPNMSVASDAACKGASIGQLAHALGFFRQSAEAPRLTSFRLPVTMDPQEYEGDTPR